MNEMIKHDISYKVRLVASTDPQQFVWVTRESKGEVECIGDTHTVDGKSILGILTLNLPEPITVVFHDVYGNEEFLKKIERWVVE